MFKYVKGSIKGTLRQIYQIIFYVLFINMMVVVCNYLKIKASAVSLAYNEE